MAFWLFKSEPSTWSWQDQIAKGAAGEIWDGVRNYQARNRLRDEMKAGDTVLIYRRSRILLSFPRRKIDYRAG